MKKRIFRLTAFIFFFTLLSHWMMGSWAIWPHTPTHGANKAGLVYYRGDVSQPKVALTFDDGPSNPCTSEILDILDRYQVKGTFFMMGRHVEEHPELAKRVADGGHVIGNHTYSHVDLKKLSLPQVSEEILRSERAIQKATGVRPHLFRPPYGSYNRKDMKEIHDLGYVMIEWTFSPKDWRSPRDKKIVKRILSHAKNGSIILLHDGAPDEASRQRTVTALPALIEGLRAKGFQIVTVPELLQSGSSQLASVPAISATF